MIIEKEVCKKRKLHQTKVFTSCMPSKRFCYYCMDEITERGKEENGINS